MATRISNAKEALIAEALGDLAGLIKRAEALPASLDKTRTAVIQATNVLATCIPASIQKVDSSALASANRAIDHIVRRTNVTTAEIRAAQTQAMTDSARQLFATEVAGALKQLTANLNDAIDRSHRPWDLWLTHAATAVSSSACTMALVLWVLRR